MSAAVATIIMEKVGPSLYAPESYINASPEIREIVTNECGVSGWKGWLIPETIWLLCITAACKIHDWMYAVGLTIEDKNEADRVFSNNMLRLINAAGGPSLLRGLRRARARKYYLAVKWYGGPAFWDKKNIPACLLPVPVVITALPVLKAAVTIKYDKPVSS